MKTTTDPNKAALNYKVSYPELNPLYHTPTVVKFLHQSSQIPEFEEIYILM